MFKIKVEKEIGDTVYEFNIEVTNYVNIAGSYSQQALSDVDYYGEEELEYDIVSVEYNDGDNNLVHYPIRSDLSKLFGCSHTKIEGEVVDDVLAAMIEAQEV